MIRKKLFAAVSFILLGLTTVLIPTQVEAARLRKYIRVSYQGQLPYVRIYIDGSYKGQVSRGGQQSYYLRTGRTYSVRATYAGRSHTQSVYLPRNFGGRY